MSLLSDLSASLFPNRAWQQRIADLSRRKRLLYFAIRLGLSILVGLVIWLVGMRQHPALK